MNSSLSSMKNGVQVNSCTFLGLGVPLNSQRFSNYFADCSVNVKLSAPCRRIPSLAKIKLEPPELTIPNENGEFVCVKCDRAFKDRELLTKHQ